MSYKIKWMDALPDRLSLRVEFDRETVSVDFPVNTTQESIVAALDSMDEGYSSSRVSGSLKKELSDLTGKTSTEIKQIIANKG